MGPELIRLVSQGSLRPRTRSYAFLDSSCPMSDLSFASFSIVRSFFFQLSIITLYYLLSLIYRLFIFRFRQWRDFDSLTILTDFLSFLVLRFSHEYRGFIRRSLVALTLVRKIVPYKWNKDISNEFKSSGRILLNLVLKNRGFRSRVSRKSGAVCVFEDDRPKSSDGWFTWLVKLTKFARFELHIHKLNDTFSISE